MSACISICFNVFVDQKRRTYDDDDDDDDSVADAANDDADDADDADVDDDDDDESTAKQAESIHFTVVIVAEKNFFSAIYIVFWTD